MEYSYRMAIGKIGQDIIINFLEKSFGYRFEAGERNSQVLNVDLIEELEGCEFIPEKTTGFNKHGNQLKFIRDGTETVLTMPDAFMSRNSRSGFYWIEAKTHTMKDDDRLIIDCENFKDYETLYTRFTRQSFLVMCLSPNQNGTYDIYHCEFQELLNNKPSQERMNYNMVYVWSMKSVMKKLNRFPIYVDGYR